MCYPLKVNNYKCKCKYSPKIVVNESNTLFLIKSLEIER